MFWRRKEPVHYCDVILSAMAFQITSLTIVYSTVYSGADQINHKSSASQAFVWGIHMYPPNGPVSRTMFPFEDVIMASAAIALFIRKYTRFNTGNNRELGLDMSQ